jgi:transcription initiation factor TFIID subunit 1
MPQVREEPDAQADADDRLIESFLAGGVEFGGDSSKSFLTNIDDRNLDPGEKADDAVDYGDISDDELPEEEPGSGAGSLHGADELPDLEAAGLDQLLGEDQGDGLDDLFGDSLENNLEHGDHSASNTLDGLAWNETQTGEPTFDDPAFGQPTFDGSTFDGIVLAPNAAEEPVFQAPDYQPGGDEPMDDITRQQMELFASHARRYYANGDLVIPTAPGTQEEVFELAFPTFEKDGIPHWQKLLPVRPSSFKGYKPLRPPKPVQPTKVNLELEQDQERSFKLNLSSAYKRKRDEEGHPGIVVISNAEAGENGEEEDSELEALDDGELIGNVNVHDIRLFCEDWNLSDGSLSESDISPSDNHVGEFSKGLLDPPTKRPRIMEGGGKSLPTLSEEFPSWDDPESLAAKHARRLHLDLNDPYLLIETQPQQSARLKRPGQDVLRDGSGSTKRTMVRRYNFSNDDAYDLLKENHSNKVRSTLGSVNIDHALPAVKLQYPFYKVSLTPKEARSFHRPTFPFPGLVKFDQLARVKSKSLKGLDARTMFRQSKDLSMADNSHMVLVEYSEECPVMLSNFGMGSKLINYYRRKDEADHNRPKRDLGETQVLLPQDKSPFSIFGNVEPGAIIPTFHNVMYRAPVFHHQPKPTDFLCIRSSNNSGSRWYLRNLDNLLLSGQQFPSMEVPGPHARKVTEAAKRRLRMISFRIFRKNRDRRARPPWLSNEMIKHHLPGSDIAQNRSKMREFMQYDKHTSSWMPKPGEVVPDEAAMEDWIKPEEICVLDSMQVGVRHLQDVGYSKEGGEVDLDDDDDKEAQGIDQQLAPWQTTKNFIHACQGKAMLELHGDGDPSRRGEAFSFIKTSMKGGFRAIGESIEDRLDAKRTKELGGHSYNVARQQQAYEDAIKRIWNAQALSLQSTLELSDAEPDVDDEEDKYPPHPKRSAARTPRTEVGTPSLLHSRRDDETGSQYSKLSHTSQLGKSMKITRTLKNGARTEEVIHDAKVISAYMRRRRAQEERAAK